MSRVKFELNLKGLNELMKGPEMQEVLSQKASQIVRTAEGISQTEDAEFEAETKPINWIAVANIRAANGKAMRDNLDHNTLRKAMDSHAE